MSKSGSSNLDITCAEIGKAFAEKIGNKKVDTITKLLMVLEEHGPYAMYLYGKAKLDIKEEVFNQFNKLCGEQCGNTNKSSIVSNIVDCITNCADHVDKYLFLQDLLRRVLIYAKYHAKAIEASEGGQ